MLSFGIQSKARIFDPSSSPLLFLHLRTTNGHRYLLVWLQTAELGDDSNPSPLLPHIQSNVDMLLTLTGIVWFKWIYHPTPQTKCFKQKKFIFYFFQGFASPLSMITNAIDLNRVTHQGEIRSPSWLNAYRLNQQRNEHMEKVEGIFFLCLLCLSIPPSIYNLLSCSLRCCTILDASMFIWTRLRIQSAGRV